MANMNRQDTDKLNNEELAHLIQIGITTKKEIRKMRKAQNELDPTREACRTCRAIAVNLGIEK